MATDYAGSAYGALIEEQLTEERSRKQSFEQRGLAVVTSAGTLVTLLFGLVAVLTKVEGFVLPDDARPFLLATLLLFTLAGSLGLIINKPQKYAEPSASWLETLTSEIVWRAPDLRLAERRTAQARVNSIRSFRDRNKRKGFALTAAIVLEVLAVACLSVAVLKILTS
ncbi:MAG TPA: hypothetical protein VHJ34_01220 [Actinomycetota bacterium]|nr:hypothetical protein [Actinomycetota bacterium]